MNILDLMLANEDLRQATITGNVDKIILHPDVSKHHPHLIDMALALNIQVMEFKHIHPTQVIVLAK